MATHTLILEDEAGRIVSSRASTFKFDGDRDDVSKRASYEEYTIAIKAREMYRDAAHAAGKWPWPKPEESHAE